MTERRREANSAVVAAAQLKVALGERFGLPVSDEDRQLASEPPAAAEWWAADEGYATVDEVKDAVEAATEASAARNRVIQFVMRLRHELATRAYSLDMGWQLDDLFQMALRGPLDGVEQAIASTIFQYDLVVGERSAVVPLVIAVLNICDHGTRDIGSDEYSDALHRQVFLALARRGGVEAPRSSGRITSGDLQRLVGWAIRTQEAPNASIDLSQTQIREKPAGLRESPRSSREA